MYTYNEGIVEIVDGVLHVVKPGSHWSLDFMKLLVFGKSVYMLECVCILYP